MYERICKEFYIDINADWRQKQTDNQGLGIMYNCWTGAFDKGVEYDKKYSFVHAATNDILHIYYVTQGSVASNAWTALILDNSKEFTRAGVKRINSGIRTYC